MSPFFALIVDRNCINCYKKSLTQLEADVTCTNCGCEQRLGNFIYDTPAKTLDFLYEHDSLAQPSHIKINKWYNDCNGGKSSKGSQEIDTNDATSLDHDTLECFNAFQRCVPVSLQIIDAAKVLLADARSAGVSKIRMDNKKPLAAAAIFFASKSFAPIDKKRLLDSCGMPIDEKDFSRSCNFLRENVAHKYKDIFCNIGDWDVALDLNAIFARLTCFDVSNQLRKLCFKIADKFKDNIQLHSVHKSTKAAVIIFIAAKALKLKFKLKLFAIQSNVSTTTINNVSKLFLSI